LAQENIKKKRKKISCSLVVGCLQERRGERPSSGAILSCSKNSMEEVRLLHVRRKYSGQGSQHTISASSSSYATPAPYQQLAGCLQEVTDSHGDHVMWGVSPRSKKRLTVPKLHHPCNVKPNIIGGSSYHQLHIVVELSSFAVGCKKLELGKIFPLYYKNAHCAIEESSSNHKVVTQHNAFTIVTEICWFGPKKIDSAKCTVQYSVPYSVNIYVYFGVTPKLCL
jgi:hypothetical protein